MENKPAGHEEVIREITPLKKGDCLYIAKRLNRTGFTFPMHIHPEYELNYIKGAAGVRRIVGDSSELIGPYDLVLITGQYMEHKWEQNECKAKSFDEIVIQFSPDLFSQDFLQNNQADSIKQMFEKARVGLSFSQQTAKQIEPLLNSITTDTQDFHTITKFMLLMYELSQSTDYKQLSSSLPTDCDSKGRMAAGFKIEEYIDSHYMENLTSKQFADMLNISETKFLSMFKLRTGNTLPDYVANIRISNAIKLLLESTMSVSEICYRLGFDSLPSFDRMFKKIVKCSPKEFRQRNNYTAPKNQQQEL